MTPSPDFGAAAGDYARHRAGFRGLETFSYDVAVPYTHESWRGRIRASAGVGAALTEERVQAFDKALAALLRERFPADPLAVPPRVWASVARKPE